MRAAKVKKAVELATRMHDATKHAHDQLRTTILAVLDGVGYGDEGGNIVIPWENSPCYSEQLNGIMELSATQC
jgi:hypothetical protein